MQIFSVLNDLCCFTLSLFQKENPFPQEEFTIINQYQSSIALWDTTYCCNCIASWRRKSDITWRLNNMLLAIASFLCRRKSTQDSHGTIYKKHATWFKMACACNVDVTSSFISKIIHSTSFLFPMCNASYYFEGYFIIPFLDLPALLFPTDLYLSDALEMRYFIILSKQAFCLCQQSLMPPGMLLVPR